MKTPHFFLFFITLILSPSGFLWAQSESPAESQESISLDPSSHLGELFFYFKELKPDQESVHALADDTVNFCFKLNSSYPKIAAYLPYLQKIELELVPNSGEGKLTGATSYQLKGLKPDSAGCYGGSIKIPKKINAGKYQLTELDLILSKNRHISLREELEDLPKIPVIDLEATEAQKAERNPFVFEKIISKSPLQQKIKTFGHWARGEIYFRLVTHDDQQALDLNSLKVFFKLYLDGTRVDILQARCSSTLKGTYFDCTLYVSRAEPDLKGRLMVLKLDSISIEDAYGNLYEMTEEKDLRGLFDAKLLQYVFYSY
ncbi:MAG: hypothetical protein HQM15_05255 [Deltaproteobacteria bacterium]|nr:hypothetical protein [Deltaproteobacteria bacterium]